MEEFSSSGEKGKGEKEEEEEEKREREQQKTWARKYKSSKMGHIKSGASFQFLRASSMTSHYQIKSSRFNRHFQSP